MKIFDFCVLVSFTSLITPYNAGYADLYGDVSLSKEMNETLNKIPDSSIRVKIERYLGKREGPESRLGFALFWWAITTMNYELEITYPKCKVKEGCREHLVKDIPLTEMQPTPQHRITIGLFTKVERTFGITERQAYVKIPYYYDMMYGFLLRCTDGDFEDSLTVESKMYGSRMRQELLAVHGIDESNQTAVEKNNTLDQKKMIFKTFSASMARIFHGCNAIYYDYLYFILETTKNLQKTTNNENVPLPKVLDDMGLLMAWNFTKEDLHNVNFIHRIIEPGGKEFFSVNVTVER